MLEKLSEEQEAKFPFYREKWLKIGFSTEPVDFEKCKKIISQHYENVGLERPSTFHLVDSPKEALELLNSRYNIDKKTALNHICYGNHDCGWLSYHDFFINETDITVDDNVRLLAELAEHCGWWYPYEDVVVIQQRPSLINFENDIVQCTDGPAIQFPDGYSVYIIDGVRLDEQIVMRPETLTVKQIKQEEDLDKRAIMIERFGWPRFLKETNAKCIDKRDNHIENTKEALFKSNNDNRLVVTCPTGRVFALGVPKTIKSCEQAQKWLGNEEESVNVIART